MIMDELLEFCDATALNTGGAGTYLLGDVIDLGALGTLKDIGNGRPIFLVLQIATTATSGGAATGNFILASDAQAAIATDGSATVHHQTGAIAVASLTAGPTGFRRVVALPTEKRYERYLGILQTTAVAAFTAGALDAFLTLDPPGWYAPPDATN